MSHRRLVHAVAGLLLGVHFSVAHAQELLFLDAAIPPGTPIAAVEDPAAVRTRYVTLNFSLLLERESLTLNLFAGDAFTAVKNRVETRETGRYSWFGALAGIEASQVILAVHDGDAAGSIVYPGKVFRILPVGLGFHAVQEIDPERLPDCGVKPGLEEDLPIPSPPPPQPPDLPDEQVYVDVMAVYTPAAAAYSGNVFAQIQLSVDSANYAREASGVAHRVRLVYLDQVNYVESGIMGTDLARLRDPSDGYMDEVHTWRSNSCADAVGLFTRSTGQYCGMAYVMTSYSESWGQYTFSVSGIGCGVDVFAHELGHNMGCHHDRYVAPQPGLYDYSHGYVNTAGRWRTIMAYNNQCADMGFSCWSIGRFSNPDVSYNGAPTGIAGVADNARTLNNSAPFIAYIRDESACDPCNDLFEPNAACGAAADFPCTAGDGPCQGALASTVCHSTDADWFRVTPLPTLSIVDGPNLTIGDMTVTLKPPPDRNYQLRVYGACGGAVLCSSLRGGDAQEQCTVRVVENKEYYVLVSGEGGAYEQLQPYALAVAVAPAAR